MESVSLFDLNEYIKRVVALNFQEPVWVNCEISQVNEVRGQVYMEVVHQKEDTDEVVAQASAVIWYKSHLFLKNKLKELLPSILTIGTHVLLKVKVDFHERYGMKLVIEDIDPSYTIGHMEMARQKILQKLADTEVMDLNRSIDLPRVLTNIAIISSPTAAGYKDFVAQLDHNEYGYRISHTLFKSAMQGANTEREICLALKTIAEEIIVYDAVVIIRGGGSKLDLSGFDSYNIGYNIATYPIPVLTGIGHEIDQSVADIVAHTAFKTPTAVATFIIDNNLTFESDITRMGQWIGQFAKQSTLLHRSYLEQATQMLLVQPKTILSAQRTYLDHHHEALSLYANHAIRGHKERLKYTENIIKLADPKTILKRGYAMLSTKNKTITTAAQLKKGDIVEITYFDGSRTAEIK